MGYYINWADVSNQHAGAAKDFDSVQAEQYVLSAEGEVNAKLGSKYTVPFAAGTYAPPIVRSLSIDLAYYRMIWMQASAKILKEYIDERFEALLKGDMVIATGSGALDFNTVLASCDRPYRSAFGPDDPINWSRSIDEQQAAIDERTDD